MKAIEFVAKEEKESMDKKVARKKRTLGEPKIKSTGFIFNRDEANARFGFEE